MLVPIIQWAIHQLDPTVEVLEPQFRKRRRSISEDLEEYGIGSMLVFVHRDSENLTLEARLREFDELTIRMWRPWCPFGCPKPGFSSTEPLLRGPLVRLPPRFRCRALRSWSESATRKPVWTTFSSGRQDDRPADEEGSSDVRSWSDG